MKKVVCFWMFLFNIAVYALPAQVLIIRHAEQNHATGELNPFGISRAAALAEFFQSNATAMRFGPIVACFGARPHPFHGENTTRVMDTVSPTAVQLHMPIHAPYAPEEEDLLVNLVLNNPAYDGRTVLIAWHHFSLPILIRAFGYTPPFEHIPSDDYFYVFVLQYPVVTSTPPPTCDYYSQALMRGDPP